MAKKIMSDIVSKNTTKARPKPKAEPKPRKDSFEKLESERIEEKLAKLNIKKKVVIRTVDTKEELDLPQNSSSSTGSKQSLWIFALVSIGILFFALSSFFASAKVIITPKIQEFNLDELFTAVRSKPGEKEIQFEIVSMDGVETTNLEANEQKQMSVPARGNVTIFNTYSTSPQKLSIDTRLEGSNGKIYKTDKEIIVPGMSADTPGSVTVGVYGFEPGEAYNSEPLDFKILGFRGTTKYNKFYGRSVESLTGGLSGKFYIVAEDAKKQVVSDLRNKLKDQLTKKVLEQTPPEYVLFKDSLVFVDGGVDNSVAQFEKVAPVSVSGSVFGYLFKKSDIIPIIAKLAIKDFEEGSEIDIPGIENLSLNYGSADSLSKDIKGFNFKLSGSGKIVYQVNQAKIMRDLLGKQKAAFKSILANSDNIESAELILRPVWRTTIPEKIKQIKIIVNYPN